VINRESVSRRLDLVATVSGDRADVADQIEEAVAEVAFPREYHAEVIWDSQHIVDRGRLLLIGACALIAVVLLLQAGMRSWMMTAAALAVIAFSMLGGLVAVALAGGEMTIGAVLGFVVVLALAVRNLFGLMSCYRALREVQGYPFGTELAIGGPVERAVPIVLSGAVAAAVLLPVAIAGSRPGLEIIHPMALVVVAGAVTATLAPLLLFPALYLRWGEHRDADVLDDDVAAPVAVPV
jgi:Cu/Ag efflux pump CusA